MVSFGQSGGPYQGRQRRCGGVDRGPRCSRRRRTRRRFFGAISDEDGSRVATPADELLEGVLRTAADEWEGRKVPFYGRLFAGVSFDDTVAPAEASYLLRLGGGLTYRQIELLAFWERVENPAQRYGQSIIVSLTIPAGEPGNTPRESVVSEMAELGAANLLGVATDDGVGRAGSTFGSSGGFAGVNQTKSG